MHSHTPTTMVVNLSHYCCLVLILMGLGMKTKDAFQCHRATSPTIISRLELRHSLARSFHELSLSLSAVHPSATSTMSMHHAPGTIDFFDEKNGYGFIKRSSLWGPKSPVYFRISSCDVQIPYPRPGEDVIFVEKLDPKGPSASPVLRTSLRQPRVKAPSMGPRKPKKTATPSASSSSSKQAAPSNLVPRQAEALSVLFKMVLWIFVAASIAAAVWNPRNAVVAIAEVIPFAWNTVVTAFSLIMTAVDTASRAWRTVTSITQAAPRMWSTAVWVLESFAVF